MVIRLILNIYYCISYLDIRIYVYDYLPLLSLDLFYLLFLHLHFLYYLKYTIRASLRIKINYNFLYHRILSQSTLLVYN